ncbi:hypothetical protein ACFXJ5_12620 [Streptomyces sp. NPDC059373]
MNKRRGASVLVAVAATLTGMFALAAPANASVPYKVYTTSAACKTAGQNFVDSGQAYKYTCTWDSPGYLLTLWLG